MLEILLISTQWTYISIFFLQTHKLEQLLQDFSKLLSQTSIGLFRKGMFNGSYTVLMILQLAIYLQAWIWRTQHAFMKLIRRATNLIKILACLLIRAIQLTLFSNFMKILKLWFGHLRFDIMESTEKFHSATTNFNAECRKCKNGIMKISKCKALLLTVGWLTKIKYFIKDLLLLNSESSSVFVFIGLSGTWNRQLC